MAAGNLERALIDLSARFDALVHELAASGAITEERTRDLLEGDIESLADIEQRAHKSARSTGSKTLRRS